MEKIVAGNWKMNGSKKSLSEIKLLDEKHKHSDVSIIVCPPTIYIEHAVSLAGTILIGGQDCHFLSNGAHTGDISAKMLADIGAHAVIVGHSERRINHAETNDIIRKKAIAAQNAKIKPIIDIKNKGFELKPNIPLKAI